MSAPQTNLSTQKRWHLAPFIGMFAAVAFALGLLFWEIMVVADGTTSNDGTLQETPAAGLKDALPESVAVPENPVPVSPVTPAPAPAVAAPVSDGDMPTPAPDLPGTSNQQPALLKN